MNTPLEINWKYTNTPYTAMEWLHNLPDAIACDFETASKYTDAEKESFQEELDSLPDQNSLYSHELRQKINSDGLSHPSLVDITHFSVAWSEQDSFVIITDTPKLRNLVYNWIIHTDRKQIWHNLSFDASHIYYNTGKFPKNYEDSAILAKTILNHVDVFKARVGLKHLQGYKYGAWSVSSDSFHKDKMYDEEVLKYACIDSTATYSLWTEMQDYLNENTLLENKDEN